MERNIYNPQPDFSSEIFRKGLEMGSSHLVGLGGLVEHAGVDGRSHQVVGSRDGMDVTGEMEVELE